MLEMWGHAPAVCHTGPAAVERVRSSAPQIVILDIGLPGMDGYEVARHLRTEIGYRGVLIALTGYAQEHDRRRSAEVGFDHHLTKPVDLAALQGALARATA
jgi:CheY-like chemotaxis protein